MQGLDLLSDNYVENNEAVHLVTSLGPSSVQMLTCSRHVLFFTEPGVPNVHLPYLCHQYVKNQYSSTGMMSAISALYHDI